MIVRGIITTKNQGVLIAIIISVPRTVMWHQINDRLFTGIVISIVSRSLENLQHNSKMDIELLLRMKTSCRMTTDLFSTGNLVLH